MTDPLPFDTLMGEFDDDYEAWILQDQQSLKYVDIPDTERYPGRVILRFFMSRSDAERVLDGIIDAGNRTISNASIIPVKVNLHTAMSSIAAEFGLGRAVG